MRGREAVETGSQYGRFEAARDLRQREGRGSLRRIAPDLLDGLTLH